MTILSTVGFGDFAPASKCILYPRYHIKRSNNFSYDRRQSVFWIHNKRGWKLNWSAKIIKSSE